MVTKLGQFKKLKCKKVFWKTFHFFVVVENIQKLNFVLQNLLVNEFQTGKGRLQLSKFKNILLFSKLKKNCDKVGTI